MKLKNFLLADRKIFFASVFLSSFTGFAMPSFDNTAIGNVALLTGQQMNEQIKGLVLDAKTGEPIIGANIIVKGSTAGTITDLNGEYVLDAPVGSIIQVSYIGYKSLELKSIKGIQKIKLFEDSETLDEVVVVGYTTQKKESLTGAMQVVSNDKLLDITTASTENLLASKVPGVQVTATSGQPGSVSKVVIRGKATVNGATDPLWVIDGVLVGSSSNNLNPNDIESISVLKDAASTAIYGSEGANGVIVVTTKKGMTGRTRVNLSVKAGLSMMNNGNLEMMNGADLYDYFSKFSNANDLPNKIKRWGPDLRNSNFDWFKNAIHNGLTQDYNLSISGGTDKIRTYTSLGYYKEEGAIKGYDLTRYNFRFNVEYDAFSWLKIKPKFSGARKDIYDAQHDASAMYYNLPWDSPYDENNNLVGDQPASWVNATSRNYLYDLQWNYSKSSQYEMMANLDFDIKITDWLKFSSVNNYKYGSAMWKKVVDARSLAGQSSKGQITDNKSSYYRIYTNQMLKFNKLFNKHSINALLGYEWNTYNGESTEQIKTGFAPGIIVANAGTTATKAAGGITEWAVLSYIMNAHYSYDNRYLAQVSFRNDGASNFGKNAKFGSFYSISAGWNINRESWFKLDCFNELKLRASYGTVGSRPGELYPQYGLYTFGISYQGIPGAMMSQVSNPDLTWEKTYTLGFGIDAKLFDRITLNFDYYNKRTTNLLYNVPLPGVLGYSYNFRNVGEVMNNGVEATLGADIIKTNDWNWNLSVNIAMNKNEVKELYGGKSEIIQDFGGVGVFGVGDKILKKGYDIDSWYLAEWAGVNPDNGSPQWYTTDKNGNRVITSNYGEAASNPVICGSSNPDFYGGFSTSLSWRNLDLSAVFSYSVGGKIYNYTRSMTDNDGAAVNYNQMKLKDGWKRWEKPGDIATHPIASYGNASQSSKTSSRYLENASYLRLRNLTLGYNWNPKVPFISNVRFYVSGENLFVVSDYSGIDPEIGNGVDLSNYPQVRKVMFGVNVAF